MSSSDALDRGREFFERGIWGKAFDELSAADRKSSVKPEDLERLATAAYLIGRDAESIELWARGHQESLDRGDVELAARCAFWLGFQLLMAGERARGSGWISRGRRVLDDSDRDCVERGFLLLPPALRALGEGDGEEAHTIFSRAGEIGERFDDPNLVTLARLGRGQARIRTGDRTGGVALLDEAMVAVEAEDLSPVVVGIVYCAVIETCQEIFDLRRAREWTAALSEWCAAQPELVPFRGQCLVWRAQILRLQGEWSKALEEVRQACEILSRPPGKGAAGSAFYEQAELHRLRGELDEAERAYRQASQRGRKPQPGLALLRLAQGRVETAEAAMRRVLEETEDRSDRTRVLAAHVEIMLAADDVPAARAASDELSEIATDLDARWSHAVAASSRGAVRLAEGDARRALETLRDAWTTWEELEAPYEAARIRAQIALACRELGDEDTAEMELDAARSALRRLGARPELARLDALDRPVSARETHGLTPREMEVLRLIAAGATNRSIGEELFISERTVERHASNIYTKLDVPSRAAATAYAYEHDLV